MNEALPAMTAAVPDPPELPEGAPRPEPAPRWPAWTAPVALIAGFGVAIVAFIAIVVIAGAFGADAGDPPPSVQISATVLQDLALVGSAVFFARMTTAPRPWHFGLMRARLRSALVWLVVAWLSFIAFSAIWAASLGLNEKDDLPDELGADESTVALIAVAILVTVVAPICEELFFRGYFFNALKTWRGLWPAALITGLVFGGIHVGSAPAAYLVPLAFFGFALCLLYQRTGSLYPCMALHALNNSLAFGVTEGWGWQIPVTMAAANAAIFLITGPLGLRRAAPEPVAGSVGGVP
jgi:membrane protease YdiL (CAAX protease family)